MRGSQGVVCAAASSAYVKPHGVEMGHEYVQESCVAMRRNVSLFGPPGLGFAGDGRMGTGG